MTSHVFMPHDRFAKVSLQEVVIARAFLQAHLEKDLQKRIHFDSMRLTNNEFVLPHLKQIHSDVVYECQIDNKASYVYFLIEHQSSPDELMAFRKLQYNVALMDQHVKKGNKKLPVILSLCLYNGKPSPYPHSSDVLDCFENVALAKEIMFKPFKLIDLSVLDDQEIEQHSIAALFELLLKHHDTKQFYNFMKYLTGLSQFQHMLKAIRNDNYLVSMLQYALNSGDERRQSLEHILQMLSNATPKHKDQIMNVAERLRNEYKPQFIAEGVQQGIEKGIEKVAKNMLLAGESVEKVSRFTGLSETHLSQIE